MRILSILSVLAAGQLAGCSGGSKTCKPECPSGQICRDGVCQVAGCTSDNQCDTAQCERCNTTTKNCISKCSVGQTCQNGNCKQFNLDIDVLFVVDDSGSMAGKQLQLAASFGKLTGVLDQKFGKDKYRIALVTTGMESPECPAYTDGCAGCMNQTGETGRFQDQRGCILGSTAPQQCVALPDPGTGDAVQFDFQASDPTCRVVTSENLDCFYSSSDFRGIVLQGNRGCGYERGLAAMRQALEPNMLSAYNSGFLRDDAALAVVVVSDEDDCGEVGDINESLAGIKATACYYAADGHDPDGSVTDPEGKAYQLTPVDDYFNFLMALKGNHDGAVKFAAIVGVKDLGDLSTTVNAYEKQSNVWQPKTVCTTGAPCTGMFCGALAGERYIKLAQMFGIGKNALVDTICQDDFSAPMEKIGNLLASPW